VGGRGAGSYRGTGFSYALENSLDVQSRPLAYIQALLLGKGEGGGLGGSPVFGAWVSYSVPPVAGLNAVALSGRGRG
jgi:hypothetical protein